MSQLRFYCHSTIDANLEDYRSPKVDWIDYLKSLPYVVDAVLNVSPRIETIITFESEAHKTWFILRWS